MALQDGEESTAIASGRGKRSKKRKLGRWQGARGTGAKSVGESRLGSRRQCGRSKCEGGQCGTDGAGSDFECVGGSTRQHAAAKSEAEQESWRSAQPGRGVESRLWTRTPRRAETRRSFDSTHSESAERVGTSSAGAASAGAARAARMTRARRAKALAEARGSDEWWVERQLWRSAQSERAEVWREAVVFRKSVLQKRCMRPF